MRSWGRKGALGLVGGLLLGGLGLLASVPALEAATPSQAVVSESPVAARDGLAVLASGGSASDAAVTAALVAGVASPTSSGIGGGGFAVTWDAKSKKPYALDFREVAPAGAVREPLERRPLERDEAGHLIGVPGEVRGLWQLHQRGGKLPFSRLVKKAADRARRGYPVSPHVAKMLSWAEGKLKPLPGFGVFYPGGKPAAAHSVLTNPHLARTLDKIAAEGPAGFYEGDVAADLVKTAREHGSAMTLQDLAAYQPKERTPLRVRYAGADVYTMPPPSAGGLMMAQVLTMFSPDELRRLGHGSAAYQHLLAEGMRGAIADRARYLADPDAQQVDLEMLLDPNRLEQRRHRISMDRTHAAPRFGLEEHGTHHLVTRDRAGNVVSLTTTVNRLFGSKVIAVGSGVVLNDELDDFTDKASVAAYGLPDTPNRLRPGARPVSSMTPTIVVRDDEVLLALGGSGGTSIATNVTQALLAALVFGHSAKKTVSERRFFVPMSGSTMMLDAGFSAEHWADLSWRGEIVSEVPFKTSGVQMIRIEESGVTGAADPRKHGSAELR